MPIPTKELLEKFINIEAIKNNNSNKISKKQCLEDINQLEFLLKYFYIGYFKFGESFFKESLQKMRDSVNNCKR